MRAFKLAILAIFILSACFREEDPELIAVFRSDFPRKKCVLEAFTIILDSIPRNVDSSKLLKNLLFPYPNITKSILWVPELWVGGIKYEITANPGGQFDFITAGPTFYNHYQKFLEGTLKQKTSSTPVYRGGKTINAPIPSDFESLRELRGKVQSCIKRWDQLEKQRKITVIFESTTPIAELDSSFQNEKVQQLPNPNTKQIENQANLSEGKSTQSQQLKKQDVGLETQKIVHSKKKKPKEVIFNHPREWKIDKLQPAQKIYLIQKNEVEK